MSKLESIFSKIPFFQHILLNTFRWMSLNYENCTLRSILFQTLRQHSDYKIGLSNRTLDQTTNRILIARYFDGNTLKMEAVNTIQITKRKKQYFQLCLERTCIFVLSTHFFASSIGSLERSLFTPVKIHIFMLQLQNLYVIPQEDRKTVIVKQQYIVVTQKRSKKDRLLTVRTITLSSTSQQKRCLMIRWDVCMSNFFYKSSKNGGKLLLKG